MDEDEFEYEEEPEVPVNPFPLGDGILPMMLFACAYIGWRARRRMVAADADGNRVFGVEKETERGKKRGISSL